MISISDLHTTTSLVLREVSSVDSQFINSNNSQLARLASMALKALEERLFQARIPSH